MPGKGVTPRGFPGPRSRKPTSQHPQFQQGVAPPISGYLAWYDAADLSTIVSSAGAVSQWNDKSGNAYHVIQATAANKPTTGTQTQNGLNVISFNGTNNVLTRNSVPSLSATMTWFCVVRFNSLASVHGEMEIINGGSNNAAIMYFDAVSNKIQASGPSGTQVSPLVEQIGEASVLTTRLNGAASVIRRNGAPGVVGNFGTPVDAGWDLGLNTPAGNINPLDGVLCEIIAYNRALSDAESAIVESYLTDKWMLLPAPRVVLTPPQLALEPLQVAQVLPGWDPNRAETVPTFIEVQARNIPQAVPAVQVIQGIQVAAAAVAQPWAQTVQAQNLPEPAPINGQILVALQVGNPPTQAAATQNIVKTNIPQPLQTVTVTPGPNPSSVETVPVPVYVQARPIPEPVPPEAVAFGPPVPVVETVPTFITIQARNIPQPTQTAQIIPGRDAAGFRTVNAGITVQAQNIPQPLAAVQVLPGWNPSSVETVPLGAQITAQPRPEPLQSTAIWVALQVGNPPAVQPTVAEPLIQAQNIPQPAPVDGQVFVALQVGNPPPVVTANTAITVQAQNIPQPVPAAQVATGPNPSNVETVPVPIFIRSAAPPEPVPAEAVAFGPPAPQVETVPLGPLVTAQPVPQPLQTAQVIPGRNPSATPPATPVPVMVASSSIPITAPNVQLLHAPNPSADETVPLGALVRSVPFPQPPPPAQVIRGGWLPDNMVVPAWKQLIQATNIPQPVPFAQLWAVFTAAVVITPPAPGCVHVSSSGASITPSSTGQNITPSTAGASAAVATARGSQTGTVMAAAATVTSILAGMTPSVARSSATPSTQGGSAQPSTQAGSATTTVSRGSVTTGVSASTVTLDDEKEC